MEGWGRKKACSEKDSPRDQDILHATRQRDKKNLDSPLDDVVLFDHLDGARQPDLVLSPPGLGGCTVFLHLIVVDVCVFLYVLSVSVSGAVERSTGQHDGGGKGAWIVPILR